MRLYAQAGLSCMLALMVGVGPLQAATVDPGTVAQASTTQSTGSLTGTVTDARGSALSGATVLVSGAGTNSSTTTDGSGRFRFTLAPGVYDVVVNKGGFQSNQTDAVGVVAGSGTNLAVALSELNLSSLRVIGRVTSTGRNGINNRPSAVTTLGGDQVLERVNPNLNDVVPELPGVTLGRGTGSTPNSSFIIRGAILETKTQIDGHVLSSGVFGTYNTNYANSAIFQQVEVVKGAGLNGPNAGESPIGTVNLRTRDFSRGNTANVTLGVDSFGGSYYNAYASGNTMRDDKLSFVVAKSFTGYRGPADSYLGNRIGATSAGPGYTLNDTLGQSALVQYQEDLTYRYSLEAELAKLRYRFSPSTSLSVQYLGLQGQYLPQGGSYASYSGNRVVAPCFTNNASGSGFTATADPTQCYGPNGGGAANPATAPFAQYNPPYAQQLIGQNVPLYGFFPNSIVQNNEPYFSAELRTGFKNDTILIRPYAAVINRFISGALENRAPGNGGGWFAVTNPANCQAAFVSPNVKTGTLPKGPCFQGPSIGGPAFVNGTGPGTVFATTRTPLPCSVANPCYTTPTTQENDGLLGYGTPFSQPEVDRLRGITFQYLHPAGSNLFGFSYDYNSDDTFKQTGDTTLPPAGCTATVGNGANVPGAPGYQATCPLPFLPRTGLDIPPTQIRKGNYALTGVLQAGAKTQVQLGAYLTTWNANYQIEDPAQTAALGNVAPVSLVKQTRSLTHFDPVLGFVFRPTPYSSIRGSAGSGVTVPFAGQISGFPNVDLPNGANNNTYTLSAKNPTLQPETSVVYNLGGDFKLADGGLLGVDLFNNTIHNVFVQNIIPASASNPVPGCPSAGAACQSSLTINGPIQRNYGIEISATKVVPLGFGYFTSATLQRAFLDQLPTSIYSVAGGSNLINAKQLDGNGSNVVPYFKAYGELRYTWQHSGLFTLGVDWLGANNDTYGPAFAKFNSTFRTEVAPRTALQIAVDNLFNYNSGTFIGQATLSNGFARSRLVPGPNGSLAFSNTTSSLQTVPPRNVRIQLSRQVGR